MSRILVYEAGEDYIFGTSNANEAYVSESGVSADADGKDYVEDKVETSDEIFMADSAMIDGVTAQLGIASSADSLTTAISSSTSVGYTYRGGYATITAGSSSSSVSSGYSKVNLATNLTGFSIGGGNISINSSSGTLTIQNTRGKYMTYADSSGSPFAYSYVGSNSVSTNTSVGGSYSSVSSSYNTINNSSRTLYGVIVGGDNVNDSIKAGSGGSSLWGGTGGNDTLVGGSGYDEFIYRLGSGNDVIQGASSSDLVNLEGMTLGQISNISTSSSQIYATFSDGGSLRIQGSEDVGIKVDGWTVVYNHAGGSWSVK